jgi:hypothetical protein
LELFLQAVPSFERFYGADGCLIDTGVFGFFGHVVMCLVAGGSINADSRTKPRFQSYLSVEPLNGASVTSQWHLVNEVRLSLSSLLHEPMTFGSLLLWSLPGFTTSSSDPDQAHANGGPCMSCQAAGHDLSGYGGTLVEVPLRTAGGKCGETDKTLNECVWIADILQFEAR